MSTSVNGCLQNEDQRNAMLQFREAVQDILQSHHDDQFLLRWLKARKFDLPKAEKMIRESFKFRKRCQVDKVLINFEVPEVIKKFTKTVCLGLAKDFSVVRFGLFGTIDCRGFIASMTLLQTLMVFVYHIEQDLRLIEERKKSHQPYEDKCTYIFDLKDFDPRQVLDRSASRYFNFIFSFFKPFIDKGTLSKIKIFGVDDYREELLAHMDADILPAFLGGDRTDPDGDPRCSSILNWTYKIPESYYLTPEQRYRPAEPDMAALTIPRRSRHECPVRVRSPGAVISWLFQTRDCNLRFGLFYCGDEGSSPEAVLPVDCVDCHLVAERGNFVCERIGRYVLHFDNTCSWLTAKHLLYKLKVEEPGSEIIVIR